MSSDDEESVTEPIRVLFVDDEERLVEFAARFLEDLREAFVVVTETSAEAALDRLDREGAPDCIVSDYRMPGIDGLEFLETVREEHSKVPFVLSTGKGSEEVASEAISAGVTDYLRKDTGTDQYAVLANRIENAVAQRRAERALAERERRLAAQRDELATLDRINAVIQGIIRNLVAAATREEIEHTICERLAASELYEFAWIAERGTGGDLAIRTGAGIDDTDDVHVATDGGAVAEPAERALETGGVQVLEATDGSIAEEHEAATDHEHRSAAAIPLSYENVVYGVLAVYSTRRDAFSEREQSGFAVLGEIAGFAINAAQNMQLLLSDTAVALELHVPDGSAFATNLTERLDCQYSLDGVVPGADGTLLQYVVVDGVAPDRVLDVADESDLVAEARLVTEREAGGVFELAITDSPVSTLVEVGGTVQEFTAEDGEARVVAEIATDADVRTVVDAFEAAYPGAELLSKRTVELPLRTEGTFRQSLDERLTQKQRSALRAAYFAGYYDWPRDSTAEQVASSMGITSPTLHNHLRKAQRELAAAFLENDPDA
ncbi:bacterio-opsin activator domain-containing protein [Halococcus saccharolyticus]|uniref:Bacterio-opsin activator-like protein n=1 Tax=Halococcus saccharolyticus DSM 5350 TaxID=1227455 RepID=M0MRD6_9EURY|nr:bacterio-opsin activator domain-containing protein [Halococcus saccharolyticus]EMA46995.1 bacterio-opsin activator-like protein [Halococcus saccharolyticus DSM 5350]